MAKKRRSRRSHDEETTSQRPSFIAEAEMHPARRLEAIGVVVLIAALALCFALFSFEPGDASGKSNLVGPIGVGLANALLGTIGVIGYIAAIALCIAARA